MDCAEKGVCHSVNWVGQVSGAQDGVVHKGGRGCNDRGSGNHRGRGNNCGGNGRCGGNNSVVAETVAKTSKDDLSISISLPLLVVVSMVVVVVQGRGTGDRDVGAVHTRGALVAQRVAVVGNSMVSSVVTSMRVGAPLPAAGHSGAKVVGAEPNVAGVDKASRGGGNSVDRVGQGRVAKDGRGNSGNGRGGNNSGVVAKTVANRPKTSNDHLSVSLSFPLLLSKRPGSIGESSVGQGGTSAGNGQVQSVHTRGTLASEGVHSISIGEGEGRVNHVGGGDGRNGGKSNLKNIERYLFEFVASS